ncbi:MAG: UvrD-helicase domain-containing protein [Desulfobacteraceae bacterium]|nr:UvrD-helicase domain-containing protein [Desulfobacteraceae bacterium]
MKPTDEQQTIIDCELALDEVLKVRAFAGTGKTTTLVNYAAARPGMRFLYIAFNKGVQLEACKRFGPNVVCKTSHALAFPRFGAKHQNRLVPGFKANCVLEALKLETFEDAKFAIDTLQNYLVSSDDKVTKSHIPFAAKAYYHQFNKPVPDLVDWANQLGRLMCNGTDPQIGMTHDGYLKLYQLSNPDLNYDCIMLDEAQDINPVTAAFVFRQKGVRKILVGDPNQQIYSFRGAKNSMDAIEATHNLYLTTSFRFNGKIASIANMMLKHFKGEKKKLVGLKQKKGDLLHRQQTIIARTNSRIFDEAITQIAKKKKISFVGDIAGYRFHRILDCYYLYIDQKHKASDPYLKSFEGFALLEIYAKAVEDKELLSMCGVVRKHRHNIPIQVRAIQAAVVSTAEADVILTTAHKAKGLEWPRVRLADDFPDLVVDNERVAPSGIESDEVNLIYVSMTRAMDKLSFDKECSVIKFIESCQREQA